MATKARWEVTLFLGLLSAVGWAAEVPLEERVKRLEKQLEEISAQRPVADGPQLTLSGQYRINAYSADNDTGGDNQTASRVRIRQGIDLTFDEQLKAHLQLELGHTTGNVSTTSKDLKVRHAVLDYTFTNKVNAQAGIVPLSDYFGDALFSSDWDYNPVALAFAAPAGAGRLRAFAGSLAEGDESVAEDDFVHYQLDYLLPIAGGHQLNFGLTYADITGSATPAASHSHINYGAGLQYRLNNALTFKGFVLGSRTDKGLLATASDANGVAVKLELTGRAGRGDFGLMLTHASGAADGGGFLPLMAPAATNGYWGYTGLLTVQGPTDTGFDGDAVNISNNGFGLTAVQAKYVFPVTERLRAYLAAGWFGNADTPAGRGDEVGRDVLLMGTYRLHKYLSLDFGAAYARIDDAVSGYANGVIGGASFNQAAGVSRDKSVAFTRLQAEF